MRDRNFASVVLCRKLAKAIGEKWASGLWLRSGDHWHVENVTAAADELGPDCVPAYGIGDLAAWCEDRGIPCEVLYTALGTRQRWGCVGNISNSAATCVDALALAVLAAVKAEPKRTSKKQGA